VTRQQAEQVQTEFYDKLNNELKDKCGNVVQAYLNSCELNSGRGEQEREEPQPQEQEDNMFNFGEQEQEPAPTPKPQPTPKPENMTPQPQQQDGMHGMFNFDFIKDFIDGAVKKEIPEIAKNMQQDNKAAILDAAQELKPTIIQINNKPAGEIKGTVHKDFKKAFRILTATGRLYLKGDSGTGKGVLARQIAEGLNLSFGILPLTAGVTESKITGLMQIDGTFNSTSFLNAYENGGVFLFDEVDAADSNTLLTINDGIESGQMYIPNRKEKPYAKRHKDFYLICAANTWGTGNEADYHGREYQDAAFLNRFSASKMLIDYDVELEKELLKDAPELLKALHNMRTNVRKNNVPKEISTRTLRDAYLLELSEFSLKEILDIIMVDWTDEEKAKAA